MYQTFFSLKKSPFSASPDPDFLFLSNSHQEAMAHLTYGLQGNGGFVVLTGEAGTGKTMVCHSLLKEMPSDTDVAFITPPKEHAVELLSKICDAFGLEFSRENESVHFLFHVISTWMLSNYSQGRKAIVLIDDAHTLSFDMLEQLRLLTNIESNYQKPLQIILIGRTRLQETLQSNSLRQLSQRITARYQLQRLTKDEVLFYIKHRLKIAGSNAPIFEDKALKKIIELSEGTPALINLICDKCLLFSFTSDKKSVSAKLVQRISKEIDYIGTKKVSTKQLVGLFVFILSLLVVTIAFQFTALTHYFSETSKSDVVEASNLIQEKVKLNVEDQSETEFLLQKITHKKNNFLTQAELKQIAKPSYVVQLASLKNLEQVNLFFTAFPETRFETSIYKNTKGRYIIIHGQYSHYSDAKKALSALHNTLKKANPWIKTYQDVYDEFILR